MRPRFLLVFRGQVYYCASSLLLVSVEPGQLEERVRFPTSMPCGSSTSRGSAEPRVAEGRRDTGRGSQAGQWGPELAPPYPHSHPPPPEGTLVVARWTESSVDEPATVQERPGVAPSGESSGVSRWLSCSTPSVAPDPLSPCSPHSLPAP